MSSCEPIQTRDSTEANYIVYILDGAGKIQRSEWIAAADDADALAQVEALKLPVECEFWQRDRRVGRVPACRNVADTSPGQEFSPMRRPAGESGALIQVVRLACEMIYKRVASHRGMSDA